MAALRMLEQGATFHTTRPVVQDAALRRHGGIVARAQSRLCELDVEDSGLPGDDVEERVPEAVVMVEAGFRITRINPEFSRIFGYSAEEAIGRRIKELITPDDLQEEAESLMCRMVETEEIFAVETVRLHKNGQRIPVSLIFVPVPSRGIGDIGYVIYRDLTASTRLREEQRRYHEIELELANVNRIATMGQLSASIAHELNQPLTGIITNCATCSRMLTSDPPDLIGAREAVARTLRDALRAANVVERLRALFNRQQPASDSVDLNEAIREVIGLSLDEIQSDRVFVRTELAHDLPRFRADRIQLQQVILNLLRNALDAMNGVVDRPRELVISTEWRADSGVQLSVKDSGVGFDAESTAKLFEAFYSTKPEGMGVGLSVSRSIIENHQGRIWAVLNDGPGATFHFSLPCEPPVVVL